MPESPEKSNRARFVIPCDDSEVGWEDVKTVQELLRHANSSVTLNLYAQAVTDIKRNAQSKVATLVFKSGKTQEGE